MTPQRRRDGGDGSPGPGLHLQGEASTQAESRSARGEPETHLRLNASTREAASTCLSELKSQV